MAGVHQMSAAFERVAQWGWMDTVLRHRARDLLRRSGLAGHLPETGLFLDLGGGTGHLSEAVLRRRPGRRCVCLDYALAPTPKLAVRMRHRAFHALRADGSALPFGDACFDGGWIGFVLHHVVPDRQGGILDEAARVVREGGTLVLIEDTPSSTEEHRTTLAADCRLNLETTSEPHHYRSPEAWRRALPDHGWTVEREVSFTRLFPRATLRRVRHTAFVCRKA